MFTIVEGLWLAVQERSVLIVILSLVAILAVTFIKNKNKENGDDIMSCKLRKIINTSLDFLFTISENITESVLLAKALQI